MESSSIKVLDDRDLRCGVRKNGILAAFSPQNFMGSNPIHRTTFMHIEKNSIPGEGYRLLEVGESRQLGDEILIEDPDKTDFYFICQWEYHFSPIQSSIGCHICRRKIVA